jgi:hypothetical protein
MVEPMVDASSFVTFMTMEVAVLRALVSELGWRYYTVAIVTLVAK